MLQIVETTVYGRRRKLLVRDGIPLFNPNLWISEHYPLNSEGTQKKYLGHLAMFEAFLENAKIDLSARLNKRPKSEYLLDHELAEFVSQACMASATLSHLYSGIKLLPAAYEYLSLETATQRIEIIRDYLVFLYRLLGDADTSRQAIGDVQRSLENKLDALKPSFKRRKVNEIKGLTDAQRNRLRDIMSPDSVENPFDQPALKFRNYIILQLGLHFGLRRSEMLLLKVEDIAPKLDDPSTFQLSVVDLEDPSIDPRKEAPKFKTHERMIAMPHWFASDIHTYIQEYRTGADKHPFLLVSHGRGGGSPLTIKGIDGVLKKVIGVAPELAGVSLHTLRHDAVYTMLASMEDELKVLTPEDKTTQVKKVLTWMFGWSPESNMPELYGAKYWHEVANEAALKRGERFTLNLDDEGDL